MNEPHAASLPAESKIRRRDTRMHRSPGRNAGNGTMHREETPVNHDLVSELRELIGSEVVLLPIPRGRKGPIIEGWQHFTSEKMKEPEYLAQLNHGGNIGVLLGNGLITIDLDYHAAVEAFLDVNPLRRWVVRSHRVAVGRNLD